MTAGRPTLYSEDILNKSKQYIEKCVDEEVEEMVGLSAKGTELYKTKLKVNLPSIEGLSVFLSVNRDTLYEWCKEHKEFSDILESIKSNQANVLINKGLSGDYNPTIAKLILTKHGYSDKTETDLTSKGESIQPIMVKFLDNDNRDTTGV